MATESVFKEQRKMTRVHVRLWRSVIKEEREEGIMRIKVPPTRKGEKETTPALPASPSGGAKAGGGRRRASKDPTGKSKPNR